MPTTIPIVWIDTVFTLPVERSTIWRSFKGKQKAAAAATNRKYDTSKYHIWEMLL